LEKSALQSTPSTAGCPALRGCPKKAIEGDWKGKLSLLLYAAAIPLAFWWQWISLGLYVVVALLWLIPDRRIENVLRSTDK
jgi:hypothetical protein